MYLEGVYREGGERQEEASPGCEVEEVSSTCQVPQPAAGHAHSATEIEKNAGEPDGSLPGDGVGQQLLEGLHVTDSQGRSMQRRRILIVFSHKLQLARIIKQIRQMSSLPSQCLLTINDYICTGN